MQVNGKEYTFSELWKVVRDGMRWQREGIYKKDEKDLAFDKWLDDNEIKSGGFRATTKALYNHYIEYCDKNKIEEVRRVTIKALGRRLVNKFDYANVSNVKQYKISKDLSAYEEKKVKKEISEK